MPSSNAACQTCKIRRVKCDETKPTCQKCAKSKRVCLSTDAARKASFSIYEENTFASGQKKRPRGPRSSLTLLRPHFDLQTRALAYYLKYHLQPLKGVPNISGGLSECVSAWQLSGRTCPMVDLALSSIALAVYSRTQRHPIAATEASARYHRLLQIAQKRVSNVQSQATSDICVDVCLLGAFLMGRYEGVVHGFIDDKVSSTPIMSLQSWSHYDGMMAILKIWRDNTQNPATFIIKHTRRQVIKLSLLRRYQLPDWVLDGSQFGERGLELDYDRIIVRMIAICHALRHHKQKSDMCDTEARKLRSETQRLDQALQDWVAKVPEINPYEQHILTQSDPPAWRARHIYSPKVYTYSEPDHAAVWVEYFGARLLVNKIRLRILETSHWAALDEPTHQEQRLDCIIILQRMADDLASSIPFCLGIIETVDAAKSPTHKPAVEFGTNHEITPYLVNWVAWPMVIASTIETISAKQQLWFRSELANLGRIIGDGVLQCADSEHWVVI